MDIKNIITPEQAYLLGLIWADGNIEPPYRTQIHGAYEDLILVQGSIEATGNWKFYPRAPAKPGWKKQLFIRRSDKNLVNFLLQNGYKSKSTDSACKILSQIPKRLEHYWFRGLVDGDGQFYQQKNTSIGRAYPKIAFCCHSSYEQNWTYLINLLKQLDIKYSEKRRLRERRGKTFGESSIEVYKHADIVKFGEYLYQGYEQDKIGFPRKFQSFDEIRKCPPRYGVGKYPRN